VMCGVVYVLMSVVMCGGVGCFERGCCMGDGVVCLCVVGLSIAVVSVCRLRLQFL
ncbi:hypothetical protein NDU88_007676, partial [Pleurodeles waltl]